jgi:hypothetical protein
MKKTIKLTLLFLALSTLGFAQAARKIKVNIITNQKQVDTHRLAEFANSYPKFIFNDFDEKNDSFFVTLSDGATIDEALVFLKKEGYHPYVKKADAIVYVNTDLQVQKVELSINEFENFYETQNKLN